MKTKLYKFVNVFSESLIHIKKFQDQVRASSGSSNVYETEKRKLQEEVDRLARQLKSVTSELEKQRQESLKQESRIRQVNQDRNDTQARLKYIFNEKEGLEKAVASMKHDLQMKEIFIKQLTFNDSEKSLTGKEHQDAYINLTTENQRLAAEGGMLQSKLDESQRQQLATREYYESCIGELNRNVAQFEAKLFAVEREKAELETSNYQIQEKINYILSQQAAAASIPTQPNLSVDDVKRSQSATNLPSAVPQINVDLVEFDALKNSFFSLQNDYSGAVDRIRELELLINEKVSFIVLFRVKTFTMFGNHSVSLLIPLFCFSFTIPSFPGNHDRRT